MPFELYLCHFALGGVDVSSSLTSTLFLATPVVWILDTWGFCIDWGFGGHSVLLAPASPIVADSRFQSVLFVVT